METPEVRKVLLKMAKTALIKSKQQMDAGHANNALLIAIIGSIIYSGVPACDEIIADNVGKV